MHLKRSKTFPPCLSMPFPLHTCTDMQGSRGESHVDFEESKDPNKDNCERGGAGWGGGAGGMRREYMHLKSLAKSGHSECKAAHKIHSPRRRMPQDHCTLCKTSCSSHSMPLYFQTIRLISFSCPRQEI
jgi:hypothetical protein